MVLTYGNYGQREGILLNKDESRDLYILLNKVAEEGTPQDKTLKEFVAKYRQLLN